MGSNEEKDIEYALTVLAHPELELTEEFSQWIRKGENQKLYHDMQLAYDVLAMKEKAMPDVQDEWNRFHMEVSGSVSRENTKKTRTINIHVVRRVATMAACICLLAGFAFWAYWKQKSADEPIAFMEASVIPQEVILSNDNGGEIILSQQTNKDSLASLGAMLITDRKLAYRDDASEQKVSMQTLQTPRGKDFKLVLSDGTEVWLNAESTLIYPSRFTGEKRQVELDGEAYFKVAKNKDCPFVVKTQKIETQVLGTGFNVHAYGYDEPHVTLVEGKVAVKSQRYHIMLKPGENALLDSDGIMKVQEVDTHCYMAWTEGYFYFDNAPLESILQDLGRWYNLTITVNSPQTLNYHFTFWANRKDNVEQVVEQINSIGKIKVILEGEKMIVI